jgi:hypothetical protein
MFSRVKTMHAKGKLGNAEAAFSRIALEALSHIYAWLGLVYCTSMRNDRGSTDRAFRMAVSIGPSDDDAAIEWLKL